MCALIATLQQVFPPESGVISGTAWIIIAAMATAISTLAVVIKVLYNNLRDCQEARVKTLEEQLSLVMMAKQEIEKKAKQGGRDT